jgi:hypothetical protein
MDAPMHRRIWRKELVFAGGINLAHPAHASSPMNGRAVPKIATHVPAPASSNVPRLRAD